jgi:hemerythrin
MAGRQTRKNCPFCQHPERDLIESKILQGALDVQDCDYEHQWAEGTTHRHMRRHSGEYYNNSNTQCPICTDPNRSEIEAAILEGRAGIDDFAVELGIASSLVSTHMEKHTKPIIQQHVHIEALPNAMKTVHESLSRVEKNMNRLDRLLGRVLDHVENQFDDEEEVIEMRDVETALKVHREVRDTLVELAKWMEKAETIEDKQSVSIINVLQQFYSEKSPQEWVELKSRLVASGVMSE